MPSKNCHIALNCQNMAICRYDSNYFSWTIFLYLSQLRKFPFFNIIHLSTHPLCSDHTETVSVEKTSSFSRHGLRVSWPTLPENHVALRKLVLVGMCRGGHSSQGSEKVLWGCCLGQNLGMVGVLGGELVFFGHQDGYLTINMRPRTTKMKCWVSEQRTTNNQQQSTTSGLLSRQVKVQLFAEAGCPFCRAAIAGPVWKPRFGWTLQNVTWEVTYTASWKNLCQTSTWLQDSDQRI